MQMPNAQQPNAGSNHPADRQSLPAHLLIIDDDVDGLHLIIDYLRDYDFAITTATDGADGLAQARKRRPDLILLDLSMPQPDGFEVLSRLKAAEITHATPVLLLTGRTSSADKVRGFELGAADYITKPVEEAELHARVTGQLRRARLQGALEKRLLAYQQRFGALPDTATETPCAEIPGKQVEQLYRVRQLLRERLTDPPSLNELAALVGTNQPRLSRGFRALFGTTVFGFLREARMQRARDLLAGTALPVKTVALEVGYRNTSDLTRSIKERFGMTPTELRERL